jgi:hypothetical protein
MQSYLKTFIRNERYVRLIVESLFLTIMANGQTVGLIPLLYSDGIGRVRPILDFRKPVLEPILICLKNRKE